MSACVRWISVRLLGALLAASPAAWAGETLLPATAHEHAAAEVCVEYPVLPQKASAAPQAKAIVGSRREGQMYVMQVQGAYDRSLTQPRIEVAQRLYENQPDAYDFIVVFSTFEFPTGEAYAFYNALRNDVQGLGLPVFDQGAPFGSAQRLQGYIDMAALSRWSFNRTDAGYRNAFATLTHELMHRWGVQVNYRDALGQLRDDLIGQQGSHWSYFVDSDASLMYGSDWAEIAPGRFRAVEIRQRLSWLDLYLAGLADAAEVEPFVLIRSPDALPGDPPRHGDEIVGTSDTVTIEQIVAAEGSRVPAATASPRRFRAALVLLSRPGETVDPEVLRGLDRFRADFESYFQSVTRGRATLRIDLEGDAPPPGHLPALTGSAPARASMPEQAAIQWLLQRQQSDGRWQDRPHTAIRDTASAIAALTLVSPGHAALPAAFEWLETQTPATSDQHAWRTQGLSYRAGAPIAALPVSPGAGGEGLLHGWQGSAWDSALLLATHLDSGAAEQIARLADYLSETQNADGGFGFVTASRGQTLSTALAAIALAGAQGPDHIEAAARARSWLALQGWGRTTAASTLDSIEVLLRAGEFGIPAAPRFELLQRVLDRQGIDGDFGGSVYATAVAAQAILIQRGANLRIIGAPAITPPDPIDGERVRMRVQVRNDGGQPIQTTAGQWYRGLPDGGVALGMQVTVPALLPGETTTIEAWIPTLGLAGDAEISFRADSLNQVPEGNEADNDLTLRLSVAPSPAAAELVLEHHDVQIDPPDIRTAPQSIQVRGLARNLGQLPANAVRLRLTDRAAAAGAPPLGEQVLQIPARGASEFSFPFELNEPRRLTLDLRIDPDNGFDEADEHNNLLVLDVPFVGSVDFDVLSGSVTVTPTPAIAGNDVQLSVDVINHGASNTPDTQLSARVGRDGEWQPLPSQPLQLQGGQRITRHFSWRPPVAGSYEVAITADADGVVAESDESNNRVEFTVQVQADSEPNLWIDPLGVTITPDPPRQGRPLRVSAAISNSGGAEARDVAVAVYLGDPSEGGQRIGVQRLGAPLPHGVARAIDIDIASYPQRGDAFLYVVVDSEQELEESNENDNLAQLRVTALARADLAISPSSVRLEPSSPVPGQPVRLSLDIDNSGEQAALDFVVRISERAGAQEHEIEAPRHVDAIDAGGRLTVEWSWTLRQDVAPDAITIDVDFEQRVDEGSEANNRVVLPVLGGGDGLFVAEPYISPNGDGVRDASGVVLTGEIALTQDLRLRVRNSAQRDVRDLSDEQHPESHVIRSRWDGKDDRGRVVPDGMYSLVATDAAGEVLSVMPIVVDTDREGALDAVGSDYARLQKLPVHTAAWQVPPATWPQQHMAYAVDPLAAHGGVIASSMLYESTRPVLSRQWMQRTASSLGLILLEATQIAFSPDGGALLIAMAETGLTGTRVSLWTQPASASDGALRIAQLDTRNPLPVIGFFAPDRLLVNDSTDDQPRYRMLDLASRSWRDLRAPPDGEVLLGVLEDGLLVGELRHDDDGSTNDEAVGIPSLYIPVDAARPQVDLRAVLGGQPLRYVLSPDRRRLLIHTVETDHENLYLVEIATAERKLLHGATRHVGDPLPEDTSRKHVVAELNMPGTLSLRASWLEREDVIVVHDHSIRTLLRFGAAGQLEETRELPAIERVGYYDILGESIDRIRPSLVELAESSLPVMPCPGLARPMWGDEIRSPFSIEAQRYDPAADEHYVLSGELTVGHNGYNSHIKRVCEGATDLFAVGPAGKLHRHGGWTVWPLTEWVDRQRYPALPPYDIAFPGWPATWPQYIQRNGSILQRDGRVRSAAGQLTEAPWAFARLVRSVHQDDAVFADFAPGEVRTSTVFSTLASQAGMLQATSQGRGIRLWGLAMDRNFDHYRIDFAKVDAPNAWSTLLPPTRSAVKFEEIMTWAPPEVGAYLLRLTTMDRAGNRQEHFASADSQFASPVVGARLSEEFFSPNGDGVQDQVRLDYDVVAETTQRIRVLDHVGRTVRQTIVVHDLDGLGAASWAWDGRGDDGALAPEGLYWVEMSAGFRRPVELDITAAVTAQHPDLYQIVSQNIDRSYASSFASLQVLDGVRVGRSDADSVIWESRFREEASWPMRCPHSPIQVCPGLTGEPFLPFSELVDRQWRVRVQDRAGNGAVAIAENSPEMIILRGLDDSHASADSFQFADKAARERPPFSYDPDEIPELGLERGSDGFPPIVSTSWPVKLHGTLFARDARSVRIEVAPEHAPGEWRVISQADWNRVPNARSDLRFDLMADLSEFSGDNHLLIRAAATLGNGAVLRSNPFRALLDHRAPKLAFDCRAIERPEVKAFQCLATVSGLDFYRPLSSEVLTVVFHRQGDAIESVQLTPTNIQAAATTFEFSRIFDRCEDVETMDVTYRGVKGSRTLQLQGGFFPTMSACESGRTGMRIRRLAETQCGESLPESWLLRIEVPDGLAGTYYIDLFKTDRSGPSDARGVFAKSVEIGAIEAGRVFEIPLDLREIEEGFYRAELISTAQQEGNLPPVLAAHFVVDRTAPLLTQFEPQEGQRYCARAPVVGAMSDQVGASILAMAKAAGALGHTLLPGDGGDPLKRCPGFSRQRSGCPKIDDTMRNFDLDSWNHFVGQEEERSSLYGYPLGVLPPASSAHPQGRLELSLRATDWSGRLVCSERNVVFDSRIQLDAVDRFSSDGGLRGASGAPLISPVSQNASNTRVTRKFRFMEPFRETVSLHAAVLAEDMWDIGEAIDAYPAVDRHTPEQQRSEIDLNWRPRGSDGAPVADGIYSVRYTGVDNCGFSRAFDGIVEVDGTPPEIDLRAPSSEEEISDAVLLVRGTITDPNPHRYEVNIGPAGSLAPVSAGEFSGTSERVLATWSTVGRVGQFVLQVKAWDRLGNESSVQRVFTVPQRPRLLGPASLDPRVFSPNGDGRFDVAMLDVQVLADAEVTVDVLTSAGGLVATLQPASPMLAGSRRLTWDGSRAGGVAGDGDYQLRIRAVHLGAPSTTDEIRLPVIVDTTPPALTPPMLAAHMRCDRPLAFRIVEPNFLRAHAQLSGAAGVIDELDPPDAGEWRFAMLDASSDGPVSMQIEAEDVAGNRAQLARDFILDCTPPEAAITAPVEDGIVPRDASRPAEVTGVARDANIARWALDLVEAGAEPAPVPPVIEAIATGSTEVGDDAFAACVPSSADGVYQLRLVVEDRAGNRAASLRAIRIDGTPPAVEISSPLDGADVQDMFDLSGTASDEHLLEYQVELATDAMAAQDHWVGVRQSSQQVVDDLLARMTLAQAGRWHVRVRASDAAGFSASTRVAVTMDNEPPPAPVLAMARVDDRRHVQLVWEGSEVPDLAGFQVMWGESVASGPDLIPQRHWRHLDAPEGVHSYSVHALDRAGNRSERSNVRTVRVDRTPPDVAIHAPVGGERIRGVFNVRGTAWSLDDFERFVLEALPVGSAQVVPLAQGQSAARAQMLSRWDTRQHDNEQTVQLRLRAYDDTGNQGEAAVSVVVDNDPPAAPRNVQAMESPARIELSWSPNTEPDLLGYLVYRGGELVGGGGGEDLRPYAIPENLYADVDAPDGEYDYRIYAIDLAGNVSPPSSPVPVDIEWGPPDLDLVQPQEGEVFDSPLLVLGESRDRDIAQVSFHWRSHGASSWNPLGEVMSEAPWRQTLDPVALELEYGEIEITAIASDHAGLLDPEPPLVRVVYADRTPPAPPVPAARGEDATAHLTWQPPLDDDVVSYEIQRQEWDGAWEHLVGALTGLNYDDTDLPDWEYRYRVFALDAAGNRSAPSEVVRARIYSVWFDSPYSPVSTTGLQVQAYSPSACTLDVGLESSSGVTPLPPLPLAGDPDGEVVSVTGLQRGENRFFGRCRDSDGHVSRLAEVYVVHGEVPLPPTDVLGAIDGNELVLAWNDSPSSDVVGYRVQRDGAVLGQDLRLPQPLSAESFDGPEPAVVDADMQTVWSVTSGAGIGIYTELLVEWDELALIGALRLRFADVASRAARFRVMAWSGYDWVTLATREDNAAQEPVIVLPTAYPTRTLRIAFDTVPQQGATMRLAELEPLQRALVDSGARHPLPQGRHRYTVSAVSELGFESVPSSPIIFEHGDVEAPVAVVLSGELEGIDAHLSWTPSDAADATRYLLLRDGEVIATVPLAAERRHIDRTLANGIHRYRVHVEDEAGNRSLASNEVVLNVMAEGPGLPTFTRHAPSADGGAAELRWRAGPGSVPASFVLRRAYSQQADAEYEEILRADVTAHDDLDVYEGSTHYYTLEALDGAGNSSGRTAPVAVSMPQRNREAVPSISWPTGPGEPVTWTQPQVDVCGIAAPSRDVLLYSQGSDTGYRTRSSEQTRTTALTPLPEDFGLQHFALHPGGRIGYLANGWNGYVFPVPRTSVSWAPPIESPVFDTTGQYLLGRSLQAGNQASLLRYRVRDQHVETLSFGFSDIQRQLVSRDASRWAVLGSHASEPATRQLYIVDIAASRVDVVGGSSGRALQPVDWARDGHTLLLLDEGSGGLMIWTQEQGLRELPSSAQRIGAVPPKLLPDGSAFFYLRHGSPSVELVQSDLFGGDILSVRTWEPSVSALAVSRDGRHVVVAGGGRLQLLDLSTGQFFTSIPLSVSSVRQLDWSASTRLAVGSGEHAITVDPPGQYCFDQVALRSGENWFSAVARDYAGVPGPASDPIRVDVDPEQVEAADFEVTAADIAFVPAIARPGDSVSAYYLVRNRGQMGAALDVGVDLLDPAGASRRVDLVETGMLPPGERWFGAVSLGALNLPGSHTLRVHADPLLRVAEANEGNNQAFGRISVSEHDAAVLGLTAAQTTVAPDGNASGQVTVTSYQAAFDGRVRLRIEDADGTSVTLLGDEFVSALGYAQQWRRAWNWTPGEVRSGPYRIVAELSDRDGNRVAERALSLLVLPERRIELDLRSAQPQAVVGEDVTLQARIDFLQGNAALDDAHATLQVRDAGGAGPVLWQRELGRFEPGQAVQRTVAWRTAGLAPGDYLAELRLIGAGHESSRALPLRLQSAMPQARALGEIRMEPRTIAIGDGGLARYTVRNAGTLAPLPLLSRLRLMDPASGQVLGELQQNHNLDLQAQGSGELSIAPSGLQLRTYLLQLDARIDGSETWTALAQQSVPVIDATPPAMAWLAPLTDRPQRSPVNAQVLATDAESRVDDVEYSLDGSLWKPLHNGADAAYQALLDGLSDGEHGIVARASDVWGNVAALSERRFVVDNTPPVITISQPGADSLHRAPVTPAILVQDASQTQWEAWLDDVLIDPAQPIAREGSHELVVRAEDAAGNRSQRAHRFTLDMTPPPLAILSPADGMRTPLEIVAVLVMTEPAASVRLVAGLHAATGVADDSGRLEFASVPLLPGDNPIAATASDAAGNTSPEVAISVIRTVGAELVGSIRTEAAVLEPGTALALEVRLQHSGPASLEGVRIGLDAVASGGDVLWQDEVTLTVPAGDPVTLNRMLDTAGWPLGAVALRLQRIDVLPTRVLDGAVVELADLTPPAANWLLPVAGSVIPSPVTLSAGASDALTGVASVEYREAGGAWQPLPAIGSDDYGLPAVAMADGEQRLELRAIDGAGNPSPTVTRSFVVDSTPPEILVTGVSDGGLYAHPVTPEVAMLDANPASLDITLDGVAWTSGSPVTATGHYELVARAVDQAGNHSERRLVFELDLDPPTVQVVSPPDGSLLRAMPVDVFVRSEAHARIHLLIHGDAFVVETNAAGDAVFVALDLPQGESVLQFDARDRAGNQGGVVSHRLRYAPPLKQPLRGALSAMEKTTPVGTELRLVYQVHNDDVEPLIAQRLRIRVGRADVAADLSLREFVLDLPAGAMREGDIAFDTDTWMPGAHRAVLEGWQDEEWLALADARFALVDREPPVVAFVAPAPASYHRDGATIVTTASDRLGEIVRVEVQVDDGLWMSLGAGPAPAQWQGEAILPREGEQAVRLRAFDDSGNVSPVATIRIISDVTPPRLTWSGAANEELRNTPYRIALAVEDASPHERELRLDGAPYLDDTEIRADGRHVATAVAIDAAGNRAESALAFVLDMTPPPLAVSSPENDARLYLSAVPVVGISEPGATISMRGDAVGAAVVDHHGGFLFDQVALRVGGNAFVFEAQDAAGNRSAAVDLSVVRLADGLAAIDGTLQVAARGVLGQPLLPRFDVSNRGSATLMAVGLSLHAIPLSAPGSRATREWSADLAVGETQARDTQFDTTGWPLGRVRLELHAHHQQQSVVLATAEVELVSALLPLQLEYPADRLRTSQASIPFGGTTEAGARVRVTRGAQSWDSVADSNGHFHLAQIPLSAGVNAHVVQAFAEEGRSSHAVSVEVTRVAPLPASPPVMIDASGLSAHLLLLLGVLLAGVTLLRHSPPGTASRPEGGRS